MKYETKMCVRFRRMGLAFALAILIAGCANEEQGKPTDSKPGASTGDAKKLTDVTLQLNWFPEAQHGGYYAAYVHGYFEEAGLNVTIVKGGPGVPVITNVGTEQMTFGISNADQILVGRSQEADVVAVFAPLQTSPRCIMVHKKSGVTRFEELKNMTLAINQNITFGSFLKHTQKLEGCKIEPYPGSISKFLLNDDFAQQAYVFSEPFVAKREGGDPHNLMAADVGFNPYTSVLITHGDTIKNKSDLVQKMVSASKKGWAKYLEDSTETDTHIQQQNTEIELQELAFGAKELQKLCLNEKVTTDKIGQMTGERWQAMFDLMVDCGVSEKDSVKPESAFTTKFLK
jgi:NitT/TauT family transport system substrate-binding protein